MLGTVLAVIAGIIVLIVIAVIVKAVRIVQQGFVGVITRFGEFKDIKNPGLTFIVPFIEVMKIVDVRETPRTGDRQQVITRDNVAVIVNATIFSQVVDVRLALFTNSDYLVSVDNLARTSVRAVFGSITLAVSLVTSFVAFLVGQALLSGTGVSASLFHSVKIPLNANVTCPQGGPGPGGGLPPGCKVVYSGTYVIHPSTVLFAIIGCALFVTLVAVMTFGIGALVRHTAAAIAIAIAALFIIPVLEQALPNEWRWDIMRFLPDAANQVVSVTIGGNANQHLWSAWPQLGVTVLWAAALVAVGAYLFRKRDAYAGTPELVAQVPLEDLAQRVPGQFVPHLQPLGQLERGDADLPQVRHDPGQAHRLAGPGHDHGAGPLAEHVVRVRDDRDVGDRRVARDEALKLGGRDLHPAPHHHVLGPVDVAQVLLLVAGDLQDVARLQVAVLVERVGHPAGRQVPGEHAGSLDPHDGRSPCHH